MPSSLVDTPHTLSSCNQEGLPSDLDKAWIECMRSSSSHSVSLCHFDEGDQLGAKVGNGMTKRFSYMTGLVSVKHHVLHIEVDGHEKCGKASW